MKSYSVYAGVQDALVQWYGHNAVAFLQHLLGLMYYSKKAANRPVYSYRFQLYIFVLDFYLYLGGPHHLLYSALPNWANRASIMLLSFWRDDKWFANVAWCLG
jgi:cytochrome c oxidase cbb3-type subunit I/II